MGERYLRAPDRLPGVGCGRQGLDDRARDVRREPAGRAGRLVPAALERGARSRLPLAHQQSAPGARADRHLQPLPLRGGGRAAGPSRVDRGAAPPARTARQGLLEGTLRRHQRVRAPPRSQRDEGREVLPPRSKDEQKRRFMARLDTPGKEWKFKASDVAERAHWDEYMQAFEDAITATSTAWAPWYVIPADHKPVMQAIVAAHPRRHDPGARAVLARGVGQGPGSERRGPQATRGRGGVTVALRP